MTFPTTPPATPQGPDQVRIGTSRKETNLTLLNLLEDAQELERQLKIERDRAQAIITSIGEGLVVVDKQNRIMIINPVALTLLGLTEKEVQGKRWNQCINVYQGDTELPYEDRPIGEMFASGKTIKTTIDDNFYYQGLNGKKFPVAISTSPLLEHEEVIGGVVVFHDISHEKEEKTVIEQTVAERTRQLKDKNVALEKAQMEISQGWLQGQREKARLTASINSLLSGFILTDKDGAVFMINTAAKQILSLTSPLFHVDALQSVLGEACKVHELLTKSQETKQTMRQNDIPLGTNYINIAVVPILLEVGNEFLGTAIMVEDITEQKITERARDEFFSIASHELRTPLTSIRGNTAMIMQYFGELLKGDRELMEMIQDIHSSSVRLIQIVNDFLNVSRLEMKKMTYKKSVFDMGALIKKVNKELEPSIAEKHITLELHEENPPIPQAFADPDRTKEVVLNLIGNAIKYTEHGGVTVTVAKREGMIYVVIADTGIGVPKERWDLLFRKFQQAGENIYTRDTAKSSGLGLYISKLMVEEMGGKIQLENSEVGKGSTFSFTLPTPSHPPE